MIPGCSTLASLLFAVAILDVFVPEFESSKESFHFLYREIANPTIAVLVATLRVQEVVSQCSLVGTI